MAKGVQVCRHANQGICDGCPARVKAGKKGRKRTRASYDAEPGREAPAPCVDLQPSPGQPDPRCRR